MIVFCVLCFIGLILAELFVSAGNKKASEQKKNAEPDQKDSSKE
jgi:hypothetical protein